MGNVIGSNIFNVVVILGITAMIRPLAVQLKIVRIDMPLMLAASVLFVLLLMTGGGLVRWEGALLVTGLLVYTAWSVIAGRREVLAHATPSAGPDAARPPCSLLLSIVLILAGLGMLVLGARLLVDNAIVIARHLGVSETVIGLTIVAAGTSLPELATSLMAAFRRQADLAIGNIVGSNIFNLLGIAGTSALLAPISPAGIGWLDLGAMLATSLILLPLMRTGFRLVRWEGALLLLCYGLYLWLRWPA
jgi:cation:H+ antiporter